MGDGAYRLYVEGTARLDRGDPHGAVHALDAAVAQAPGHASLLEPLGRALFATSQIRRAQTAFEEALELDPSNDFAHFGLGRCFERQGRLADAAKHYRLAAALAHVGHYERALRRVEARLVS